MEDKRFDGLKAIKTGGGDYVYDSPSVDILEAFASPFTGGRQSVVEIDAPEFTTLCPITGQPDFARIVIKYCPDELCVESKSLKLYLGSFRMFKGFHEQCVNQMVDDLVKLLSPKWLEVEGQFTPRGGIKFWPHVRYEKP